MTLFTPHAAALTATMLSLSAAAFAAAGDDAGPEHLAEDKPVRCEIAVSRAGSSLSYQARAHAEHAVTGAYRLTIRKQGWTGSAVIDQSGNFSAAPDRPAELGQATLGGDRAQYSARLRLEWEGRTLTCTDHRGTTDL